MWPVQAAWISCASVASQGHFMGKHRVHNPDAGSSGFQQSGQQQLCLLPPYLQPTQMWRRLELVHALNISHSSLNPTSMWEKHFVAWMYMDVYCLLLSTLGSRYVKIADSILFSARRVCKACPWPGWVPNKLKANDAGASDEECCLKTCKLHTCNATWISFDKLI